MGAFRMDSKQDLRFFDPDIDVQNQIADHLLGMVARREGEPFDRSKSPAWQLGWAGIELRARRESLC
jgi:hypothetical protein